ncbi:MAG: site-2 protease family protein [Alphaproteobacteria bacterium]
MTGKTLTLIEVFGFKIKVNISWVFIAMLLSWALAQGYFPTVYEGLTKITYWWMGVVAVLGLFASIVLHELAHSVVARAFGMEIKGITLWLLGGVAEMADEPPNPKAEFLMAIAGPIMSVFLSLLFFTVGAFFGVGGDMTPIGAIFQYLGTLNLILAVFNLIPAFPLDGGRVARAALWAWKGDYYWATNIAARMGSIFGLTLMALGILAALTGAGLGGLWWVILGMFVRFTADASRAQLQATHALKGRIVRDYMTRNPIIVQPDITVTGLIDNWVYKHSFEFFPVVDAGKLIGSVSLAEVRQVPPGERERTMVGDIMLPCSQETMIEAGASAAAALKQMQGTGNSLLLVMADGTLIGVIALKDLMKLIAITSALGGS